MPTSTPWGISQSKESIIRGIIFYSTSSHGGFHVSKKLNQEIHPAWRNSSGWYEEDCEWAIVAISFPEVCSQKELTLAHKTAKNYFPHKYEEATGTLVMCNESSVLREELFHETFKNHYIVVSAISYDNNFVKVSAAKGGRLPNGMLPEDMKTFLVPNEEYNSTKSGEFVINENKHKQLI